MLQEPSVGGAFGGAGSANATWSVDAKRIKTTNKTSNFFIRCSPFKSFSFESLLEPKKLPIDYL
jgi:hypothetical protein